LEEKVTETLDKLLKGVITVVEQQVQELREVFNNALQATRCDETSEWQDKTEAIDATWKPHVGSSRRSWWQWRPERNAVVAGT
jgi:hypothetical protein